MEKNLRFISLDLLRGIAALGVVAYHTIGRAVPAMSPLILLVDLFFVLSGFVLEPIFPKQSGNGQVREFIKKRAIRFWPMAVASLLTILIWFLQSGTGNRETWEPYGSNPALAFLSAVMLLQIFVVQSIWWNPPLWSLSAEWFSNLIAIPVLLRKSVRLDLLFVFLGIAFVAIGLQVDRVFIADFSPMRGFEGLGRAIAGLFLGIVIRKKFEIISKISALRSILLALTLFIFVYVCELRFGNVVFLFAAFLIAPLIISVAQKNEVISLSRLRKFAIIAGNLSFGIYVWHMVLKMIWTSLLYKIAGDDSSRLGSLTWCSVLFVLTLCSSIVATLATQRLVEKPLQNWLKSRKQKLSVS